MSGLIVRSCCGIREFARCVELQRAIWNSEAEDIVPVEVFVVAAKTGGQVLGAFDGDDQIGFALAFPSVRGDQPYLHSHMVGVLPSYQNRGVGLQIKCQQRAEALARGFCLIEWTFDPLELRNAYFNLVRLGVVIRRFAANFYGAISGPSQANLPTDRLFAEWWLTSDRVQAALAGQPLESHPRDAVVSVPTMIRKLKDTGSPAAADVQARVRTEFQAWFDRGYAVTGFVTEDDSGKYLLKADERSGSAAVSNPCIA